MAEHLPESGTSMRDRTPDVPGLVEVEFKETGARVIIDSGALGQFKQMGYFLVEEITPPALDPFHQIQQDPGEPVPVSEGPEAEAAIAAMEEG